MLSINVSILFLFSVLEAHGEVSPVSWDIKDDNLENVGRHHLEAPDHYHRAGGDPADCKVHHDAADDPDQRHHNAEDASFWFYASFLSIWLFWSRQSPTLSTEIKLVLAKYDLLNFLTNK